MHRLFALSLLVAALLVSGWRRPTPRTRPVISRVVVEGNQRIEPSTVESYLAIRAGEPYDREKVDDSIKSLYGTGLFEDVTIELRDTDLVVHVTENPIINRIAFEGNKRLETKVLEAEIQLRPRVVYTRDRGPERRQPHPRALPAQRPLCGEGRAQDHSARSEPRRSRLRDQRGPDARASAASLSSATKPIATARCVG